MSIRSKDHSRQAKSVNSKSCRDAILIATGFNPWNIVVIQILAPARIDWVQSSVVALVQEHWPRGLNRVGIYFLLQGNCVVDTVLNDNLNPDLKVGATIISLLRSLA